MDPTDALRRTQLALLKPGAILFDMDDTLYPELDYVASGFKAVALRLEQERGWPARESYQTMISLLIANGRGRVFNDVLTLHDVADATLVAQLVGHYRAHKPELSLFAGAGALLTRLKAAGLPIALVTDGLPKMQRAKIAALGLADWFNTIVLPWEINAPKPAPDGFIQAAQALGVAPEDCLVVGDNCQKDGLAAQAMGADFLKVGLGPADGSTPQVGAVATVAELTDKLDILVS